MEKVLYCFYKIILKSTRESKTSQSILSSKYSYRPMRARVVPQLFKLAFSSVLITGVTPSISDQQ